MDRPTFSFGFSSAPAQETSGDPIDTIHDVSRDRDTIDQFDRLLSPTNREFSLDDLETIHNRLTCLDRQVSSNVERDRLNSMIERTERLGVSLGADQLYRRLESCLATQEANASMDEPELTTPTSEVGGIVPSSSPAANRAELTTSMSISDGDNNVDLTADEVAFLKQAELEAKQKGHRLPVESEFLDQCWQLVASRFGIATPQFNFNSGGEEPPINGAPSRASSLSRRYRKLLDVNLEPNKAYTEEQYRRSSIIRRFQLAPLRFIKELASVCLDHMASQGSVWLWGLFPINHVYPMVVIFVAQTLTISSLVALLPIPLFILMFALTFVYGIAFLTYANKLRRTLVESIALRHLNVDLLVKRLTVKYERKLNSFFSKFVLSSFFVVFLYPLLSGENTPHAFLAIISLMFVASSFYSLCYLPPKSAVLMTTSFNRRHSMRFGAFARPIVLIPLLTLAQFGLTLAICKRYIQESDLTTIISVICRIVSVSYILYHAYRAYSINVDNESHQVEGNGKVKAASNGVEREDVKGGGLTPQRSSTPINEGSDDDNGDNNVRKEQKIHAETIAQPVRSLICDFEIHRKRLASFNVIIALLWCRLAMAFLLNSTMQGLVLAFAAILVSLTLLPFLVFVVPVVALYFAVVHFSTTFFKFVTTFLLVLTPGVIFIFRQRSGTWLRRFVGLRAAIVVVLALSAVPILQIYLSSNNEAETFEEKHHVYADFCDIVGICDSQRTTQHNGRNKIAVQSACFEMADLKVNWTGVVVSARISHRLNRAEDFFSYLPDMLSNPLRCIYGHRYEDTCKKVNEQKQIRRRRPFDQPLYSWQEPIVEEEVCQLYNKTGYYDQKPCHLNSYNQLTFTVLISVTSECFNDDDTNAGNSMLTRDVMVLFPHQFGGLIGSLDSGDTVAFRGRLMADPAIALLKVNGYHMTCIDCAFRSRLHSSGSGSGTDGQEEGADDVSLEDDHLTFKSEMTAFYRLYDAGTYLFHFFFGKLYRLS